MKIHFRSHLIFFRAVMDEEEWGRKGEDYETCEARENEKKI